MTHIIFIPLIKIRGWSIFIFQVNQDARLEKDKNQVIFDTICKGTDVRVQRLFDEQIILIHIH